MATYEIKHLKSIDINGMIHNTYASNFYERIMNLYLINTKYAVNEINKLNNCRAAKKERYDNSIQRLFEVYWPSFLKECERNNIVLRESIIDNVNRLLSCRKIDYGYAYYECPKCDQFEIVPFTCKSRFCPTCGAKYRDDRVLEIERKCINVSHRHIVFTISDKLRKYFRYDRSLIDDLFEAVNLTFSDFKVEYNKKKTKKKIRKKTFGFISTLHTFGRDIKFNPHIHALVAEAVLIDGEYKEYTFFNYERLRKCFMYNLISLLNNHIKESSKIPKHEKDDYTLTTSTIFNEYDNGFYVYAPKVNEKFKSNHELIKYVTRYSGHPAISETRIDNIDYVSNTITYRYTPHEDDNLDDDLKTGEIIVTESVYEFIEKLIVHIPENNMHNIRYYGFYSNKSKSKDIPKEKKGMLVSEYYIRKTKLNSLWKYKIIKNFDYDPLMCSSCGNQMELVIDLCYIPENMKRREYIRYG